MDYLAPERTKPASTRRGIYWLASYPKSGNTWLRMFTGHLLGLIRNDPDAENSRLMIGKYTTLECARSNYSAILTPEQISSDIRNVFRVRLHAQQLLAAKFVHSGFVKTHSAALLPGGIPQINLGVTRGALYIIRNPLDLACSASPYFGVSLNETIRRMNSPTRHIPGDDDQLAEIVSSWTIHAQSWIETLNPFVVRYEDLVEKPIETFTAFVHHAGIEATSEQINRANELASFSRLKEIESSGAFNLDPTLKGRQFFRVGKSGQWRDTLTKKQVDRIVADHRKMMERFGYLPG